METRSEHSVVLYSRLMERILRTAVVAALMALLLVAVACGDDDEETPSPSAAPTEGATGRTATPGGVASPTDEPFSGARTPVQVVATPSMNQAQLKEVRSAEHTTFDRFTLEFDIAPSGYKVEYVKPPILADPSGKEVAIDGNAFLQITIQGAVANYLITGNAYPGPNEVKPGLPALVEAELTGDFEAVLIWVLGVNEEADFRVLTLQSPPRLVVDVGHP
jgi:hypothetical protein